MFAGAIARAIVAQRDYGDGGTGSLGRPINPPGS